MLRARMGAAADRADRPFRSPPVLTHTLANGLSVYAVEQRDVPLVTFLLQIDAGAAAEGSGREGLAEICGDMLGQGTETSTLTQIASEIATFGDKLGVSVTCDATCFDLTVLSRCAAPAASLLGTLVTAPRLDRGTFEQVRSRRVRRLDLMHRVAEPQSMLLRNLYGSHPYGRMPGGDAVSLQAISLEDVVGWYDRMLCPDSARLIAVGALATEELLEIARDSFGQWARKAPPMCGSSDSTIAGIGGRARRIVVPRRGAAETELWIGLLTTPRNHADSVPLILLDAVLGGQRGGRLNEKLRREKGYTYSVRSSLDWRRGTSAWTAKLHVASSSMDAAAADALQVIADIRSTRPVTASELTRAQASLTNAHVHHFETTKGVARLVAHAALHGLSMEFLDEFIPRVDAVLADDVTRVAESYFSPENIVLVVAGDHVA